MNTWDLFSEGNEKPTPHEKFKRGIKSAGYDMDAGAKRLEDLLAKQKAERDAREKEEQKNVSEAQDEVDYDDDYQDMVRRVGEKAKAADALKAQGKQPQTKFNPKTGRYYVDHGQDKSVKENAEELNIGDPVIITGHVEFEGTTGDIIAFGQDKRFVVVNLYNHGKHSFHSSDVSFNDYAGSDEEARMHEAGYGRNRGYHQGFASPHAPRLGGRREDDEYINGPDPIDTATWYIRANGKIIKDKMGTPYHFRDKEAATNAARTMMSKSFNAGKKFMLTTKPIDDQPENEATLHTKYKRNRFSGVKQRDQTQDELSNIAMNRVKGVAEGLPQTLRKVVPGYAKREIDKKMDAEKFGRTDVDRDVNFQRYKKIQDKIKDKGVAEGKKPDNYHIVNKDGKPASLASYADRASAEKDRNAKHPDAEVRQVGPRGKVKGVSEERTETKNEKGEVTSWKDESDWRKVSKEKDGRGRVTNLSDKARRATEKLKKEKSVDEGWKSALGGAALAGAMALGGNTAHAQPSGEDFLPDIVAHVTFKVDGNTVKKDINLGTAFKSPGEASAALEKFLKAKGIKYFDYSLERVKSKDDNYLEKTPAVDTGHSGSIDSGPYRATGSNNDYMAKESIDEAVDRAAKSMMEDGYEFTEAANPAQQAAIAISMKKAGKQPKTEEKTRLDPKCWTGYKKQGTKIKGGVRVNNCVPVEEENKGLYYNVNKRKKAGTSRDADHPNAPTAQAWKDAAKTAKTEDIIESMTPDEQFDMIEHMVESLALARGVDAEQIWEDLESFDDDTLLAESAAWRRKEGKSKAGGLNAKGVASYRRENPGSKLQTAVTTKPSKLKAGSKAAKRRKSFCARMGGVKGPMKKPNGKPTRKALALRKWNC